MHFESLRLTDRVSHILIIFLCISFSVFCSLCNMHIWSVLKPKSAFTCMSTKSLFLNFYVIHTHLFNGPFSWVSWYQKGKTNLDFTEARDSEWQWHQLGHMQACTSLQTDNHASTRPLSFYRSMLCIRGTSHGPVSVCLCLSVCHKSEFY